MIVNNVEVSIVESRDEVYHDVSKKHQVHH